jgi:hypothetical protein
MKDQPVDINATLTYLSDLPVYENEKLFEIWADNAPTELPRTNTEFTEHGDVLIEDLRYRPIQPDLDSTGFTFLKHESACLPRAEDMLAAEPTEMLYQYLEEVIELIKELLQADKVLCFDWRVSQRLTGCETHLTHISIGKTSQGNIRTSSTRTSHLRVSKA